jgi:hypothetical protein
MDMTRSLAFASLLWCAAGPLLAQSDSTLRSTPDARGRRIASIGTVGKAPIIDGKLEDEAWSSGVVISEFIQRDPREGEALTERTEVRILTDGQAIYVGAWLYDRDPSGIVRGEKIRDATLTNSDYFGFIFDTFLDRQNGFVFSTTPAGVEYDGQVVKEGEGGGVFQTGQTRAQAGSMGGFNLNWDGNWKVATSIDDKGWYAEFRIPFSTLRYGPGKIQDWGFNLVRSIRRKNEEGFWAPIPRQFGLMRVSRAGTIQQLAVPAQRTATLTPYALTAATRDARSNFTTDGTAEVGFDAKLGLTPSLTLDLTYNTDFAQVEVDEQRTNLTRFPLFFPEKRPFFLENAGVFSAGTPQAVDLFFSRRIGIDSLGNPVPILGGGRLTGKVGGATVGLLQIFTEKVGGVQPANSYSVGRVNKEFGRSRLGLLAIQRIATDSGADHNRTYAFDGRLAFNEALTLDWWGAKSETPRLTGRDAGFSVRFGHQTRVWNNSIRFVQLGEDFNNEVGFTNRTGYRYYEGALFRTVPIKSKTLRYWTPHLNYRGYFGFGGQIQSEQIHIDFGEVEFQDGGRFGPELNLFREGLTTPFAISTTDTLPVGVYDWANLAWDISSNPSAPFAVSGRVEMAGFYNGSRYGGNATVTLRKRSLTTSLLVDYNDVHLKNSRSGSQRDGNFIRSLVGLRVGYFFTPRMFVQSLVQYNNQAQIWSANARFGWLNTAGTGLFIVLNEAQEANGVFDWRRSFARSFVVKYTRQFGR